MMLIIFLQTNPTPTSVKTLTKSELELLAQYFGVQYRRDIRRDDLYCLVIGKMFDSSDNSDLGHVGTRGEEQKVEGPSPNMGMELELARVQLEMQKAKFDHEFRMKQL